MAASCICDCVWNGTTWDCSLISGAGAGCQVPSYNGIVIGIPVPMPCIEGTPIYTPEPSPSTTPLATPVSTPIYTPFATPVATPLATTTCSDKKCKYKWQGARNHPNLGYWVLDNNPCGQGCGCQYPASIPRPEDREFWFPVNIPSQVPWDIIDESSCVSQTAIIPPLECGECSWKYDFPPNNWRDWPINWQDFPLGSMAPPPRKKPEWTLTNGGCKNNCICKKPDYEPPYPGLFENFQPRRDATPCAANVEVTPTVNTGTCKYKYIHIALGMGWWSLQEKNCPSGKTCECVPPNGTPFSDELIIIPGVGGIYQKVLKPVFVGYKTVIKWVPNKMFPGGPRPPVMQPAYPKPKPGRKPGDPFPDPVYVPQQPKPINGWRGPDKPYIHPWANEPIMPEPYLVPVEVLVPIYSWEFVYIFLPFSLPTGWNTPWEVTVPAIITSPFAFDVEFYSGEDKQIASDPCENPRCFCVAKQLPCGICNWFWDGSSWGLMNSDIWNNCVCSPPLNPGSTTERYKTTSASPLTLDKTSLYWDCYEDPHNTCGLGESCEYPWDHMENINLGDVIVTNCLGAKLPIPPQYANLPTPLPTNAKPTITPTPLPSVTMNADNPCKGTCICTWKSLAPFFGNDWICVPNPANPPEAGCECNTAQGSPDYESIAAAFDANQITTIQNTEGLQIEVDSSYIGTLRPPCSDNCTGYCMWAWFYDQWHNFTLDKNQCSGGCMCVLPDIFGNFEGHVRITKCSNEQNVTITNSSIDNVGYNNALDTSKNDEGYSTQSTFTQTMIDENGQVKVVAVKDGNVMDSKIKGISSVIGLRKQP